MEQNESSQSRVLLGVVELSAGRPLVDNEDSCFILRGEALQLLCACGQAFTSAGSGKLTPRTLMIDHKKPQIMIIDIDCRVKESGMCDGPVFSCEAKSCSSGKCGGSVFSWEAKSCSSGKCGGPVFPCEAMSCSDQILVEG